MKRLLSIILVVVAIASTSAQTLRNTSKMYTTLSSSIDSAICVNAGSASLSAQIFAGHATSIQVKIVKVSGTLAGTMTLYGSNDGVNFTALTDATSAPTITTYTVTDTGSYSAPQTKVWFVKDHSMKYYKITWVGASTMNGYFKAVHMYN